MTHDLHPLQGAGFRYTETDSYLGRVQRGLPPVIICCAVNGGVQGKEANPAIPESAEEVADAVHAAHRAGAAMVHVHARDPDEPPEPARTAHHWQQVVRLIRERCADVIINVTTGGSVGMTDVERLASLESGADMASLNLTPDMSLVRTRERRAPLRSPRPAAEIDDCWAVTFGMVETFARAMQARGLKPELETNHSGGASVVRHLIAKGLIAAPYWIQTVMGYQAASPPTVQAVLDLLRDFPDGALWLCSGIGAHQLPMTTLALLMGGHVRVGLEDNVYYRRGELAESNAQLVARTVRQAHELNRAVATPADARAMLGMTTSRTR
jgi:3-keto-5-aminohexanoate cleavage enzyme